MAKKKKLKWALIGAAVVVTFTVWATLFRYRPVTDVEELHGVWESAGFHSPINWTQPIKSYRQRSSENRESLIGNIFYLYTTNGYCVMFQQTTNGFISMGDATYQLHGDRISVVYHWPTPRYWPSAWGDPTKDQSTVERNSRHLRFHATRGRSYGLWRKTKMRPAEVLLKIKRQPSSPTPAAKGMDE